ncbi:MAG: DNA polymerase III subunit beta [Tissierellia bacterium]|nr:DNA polymerase III subunit beta [Tissierellia bacterium]
MIFQIEKGNLQTAVATAARAISQRTNLQILEGLMLEARDGNIIVRATDTELSIETVAPAMVEEEGSIVLNSRLITEIVRKLPSAMVHIATEGSKVHLRCGNSSFDMMSQNADDYPDMPSLEDSHRVEVATESLLQAFGRTSFAVATDDMRIALTGVYMNSTPEGLDFVALDGYRMAVEHIAGFESLNRGIILPSRAVQELSKLLKEGGSIPMTLGNNHICFTFDNTKFYTKLLNGDYFKYQQLIRRDHPITVHVDRRALADALERASLMTGKERSGLVRLNMEENTLHITSNSEIGAVHEVLSMEKEGADLMIAFNARYLLEGLKVVSADEVTLGFVDAVSPMIMTLEEDPNFLYLALPVRLGGQ